MFLSIIVLIVGFALLIGGGHFLVEGASAVARKFKVSPLMIGLTIVAFGTSAPELVVNLIAGLNGSADLAVGNILGSNISNLLLILGVAALVYPLKVGSGTVWKEIPLSILAALVLFFVANDRLLDGVSSGAFIGRGDGLVMLCFFIIFVYYTFGIAKVEGNDGEKAKKMPVWKSVLYVLLGMLGLAYGGNLVVEQAVEIARLFGLSEAVIGLTIVAIGTSLPELVTSVTAALKKENDIAIGNVIGSNIFNLFWILGLTAFVSPIPFNEVHNFDVFVIVGASLLLLIFMFNGRKHHLDRWQGAIFVAMYASYITYLVTSSIVIT